MSCADSKFSVLVLSLLLASSVAIFIFAVFSHHSGNPAETVDEREIAIAFCPPNVHVHEIGDGDYSKHELIERSFEDSDAEVPFEVNSKQYVDVEDLDRTKRQSGSSHVFVATRTSATPSLRRCMCSGGDSAVSSNPWDSVLDSLETDIINTGIDGARGPPRCGGGPLEPPCPSAEEGSVGRPGPRGPKGDKGSMGHPGPPAPPGQPGMKGLPHPDCRTGCAVGPKGNKGPRGHPGLPAMPAPCGPRKRREARSTFADIPSDGFTIDRCALNGAMCDYVYVYWLVEVCFLVKGVQEKAKLDIVLKGSPTKVLLLHGGVTVDSEILDVGEAANLAVVRRKDSIDFEVNWKVPVELSEPASMVTVNFPQKKIKGTDGKRYKFTYLDVVAALAFNAALIFCAKLMVLCAQ